MGVRTVGLPCLGCVAIGARLCIDAPWRRQSEDDKSQRVGLTLEAAPAGMGVGEPAPVTALHAGVPQGTIQQAAAAEEAVVSVLRRMRAEYAALTTHHDRACAKYRALAVQQRGAGSKSGARTAQQKAWLAQITQQRKRLGQLEASIRKHEGNMRALRDVFEQRESLLLSQTMEHAIGMARGDLTVAVVGDAVDRLHENHSQIREMGQLLASTDPLAATDDGQVAELARMDAAAADTTLDTLAAELEGIAPASPPEPDRAPPDVVAVLAAAAAAPPAVEPAVGGSRRVEVDTGLL